jgi:hypothetical protein
MVDQSALPGAFTHISTVTLPVGCVINVGVNGATLKGSGGGTQAEYVGGPGFRFLQIGGATWVNYVGHA